MTFSPNLRGAVAIGLGLTLAAPVWAQEVSDAAPIEEAELEWSKIKLHILPFLAEDELGILRVVLKSKDALVLFVPADQEGFAALAVSPDDGFIRDGTPVASATALAGFPDAETARTAALEGCDKLRAGAVPCQIVLEVAPKE